MDRLTREEIVEAFRLGKVHCSTQTFNALCDMALHSLESVRSEVLDELTKHELPHRGNDAEGYALVRLDDVCAAIRTLKREPKAALSPARPHRSSESVDFIERCSLEGNLVRDWRCFLGFHHWSLWEQYCWPGVLSLGERRKCYRCNKYEQR